MSRTYRTETRSIGLDVDAETAFDFLVDPENLPRWATGFCRSVERHGDHLRVETPRGPVKLEIVSDREAGVVDWWTEPAPGVRHVAYSRVVPNGEGCEYLFTQLHFPELDEEQFRSQVESLVEELQLLARRLSEEQERG